MQKDTKKKIIIGIILFCLILIVIPGIVILLTTISLIKVNCDSAWIGFWGSYLGSIVGGIITLYVLRKTIEANNDNLERTILVEKEKEANNKREKFCDELCEKLLMLSVDAANDISARCFSNSVSNDLVKNVAVTFSIMRVKINSKQNDPRLKKCNELIDALDIFEKQYADLIGAMSLGKRNEAWIAAALDFSNKANVFNDKVKEFYLANITE